MSEEEKKPPKRKPLTASPAAQKALEKRLAEQKEKKRKPLDGNTEQPALETTQEAPDNTVSARSIPSLELDTPEIHLNGILRKRIAVRQDIVHGDWKDNYHDTFDLYERDMDLAAREHINSVDKGEAIEMELTIPNAKVLNTLEYKLGRARLLDGVTTFNGDPLPDFYRCDDDDPVMDALEDLETGERDEPVTVPISISRRSQFTKVLTALSAEQREGFINDFVEASGVEFPGYTVTNLLLKAQALAEMRKEYKLLKQEDERIADDERKHGMTITKQVKAERRMQVEEDYPDVFYRLPGKHEVDLAASLSRAKGQDNQVG